MTSLHESRETQTEEGRRIIAAAKVLVQAAWIQGQEGTLSRSLWMKRRRYQSRRTEGGTGPRCLPCSRTAVVRTSPQGSGETWTTGMLQLGERGKGESGTAAVLAQVQLLERDARSAWGKSGKVSCRAVWSGRRGSLGWRKGVG